MRKPSSFIATLVLFIVLLPAGGSANSQALLAGLPSSPPIHPDPDLADLPYLDLGRSQPDSAADPSMPQAIPWIKLVFQSYRHGQWEIYLAEHDGSNLTRLTDHNASDIQPRLDRGCTRIVFVSNRTGNYEIYTMHLDGSNLTQLTSTFTNEAQPDWSPDGSRIAYQYEYDGQNEIMMMNSDGSGQTRLTVDDGYDGGPAWSPDGTKIAFTSNRTGDYHIWVKDLDSGNETQLSTQPYSKNPAWSPDGNQIAYDADGDGDGWQELWVMNADGTGQQEVYDPGDERDAWVRSWSPDGKHVAFTHISFILYQGNWYWTEAHLYTWNSETGNTAELIGGDVEWRPDLQTTDAILPSSQVQPLLAQSPASFTVTWSGSDAGGSGLASYDVQVKDGSGGAWTDWQPATAETLATYTGIGGHTYYFRSRVRDHAFNLEAWPSDPDAWTTVEAVPPRTSVQPLSAYSHPHLFVQWTGHDPGGSGIQTYDVQYWDTAAGDWTDWQIETLETQAGFSGTVGHTYHFRSRATDLAQNVEGWPAGSGDTSVTLYTWAMRGAASDNTGTPVSGVVVTTTPQALIVTSGEQDGSYTAVVATIAEQYTADWHKSSYSSLPATDFSPFADAVVDVVLPPHDNGVLDWGFESGSLGTDWLPGGTFTPVVTSTLKHTGHNSARLGGRQLTPPHNLSNHPAGFPQVATDGAGTVYVAWTQEEGIDDEIYYSRRGVDGAWSSPQNLSQTASNSADAQLAVDKSGVVHLVWVDNATGHYNIYYTWRDSEDNRPSPLNISNSTEGAYLPQLAVDGDGIVHVVWEDLRTGDPDVYYAWRASDGSWSSPLNLSNTSARSQDVQLAVDGNNNAHVVWDDDITGNYDIYYTQRGIDGTWSSPQNITHDASESYPPALAVTEDGIIHVAWLDHIEYTSDDIHHAWRRSDGTWSTPLNLSNKGVANEPSMIADSEGVVHVVWGDGNEICYLRRSSDGSWSARQNLSQNEQPSYSPDLAIGEGGVIYVAWVDYPPSSGSSDIYYTRQGSDGNWSDPQNLSASPGGSYPTQLTVDEHGTGHILWADSSPGAEGVYYVGPAFAEQTGDSSIAQVVTIPLTMSTPTLSFLYQLGGAAVSNGTGFVVQVDNGITPTTLLSTSSNVDAWTHRWFDLTPWAGQLVTLTFNIHEATSRPMVWAYLDEVTVGSTYPDVWASKENLTASALPGESAAFILSYGNQGGASAQGVHLTDTLPSGLAFVAASPPPLTTTPTLIWDVGDLPAKSESFQIIVTATVAATTPRRIYLTNTVSIQTASLELETANNESQATIFVGQRLYLPLVNKQY